MKMFSQFHQLILFTIIAFHFIRLTQSASYHQNDRRTIEPTRSISLETNDTATDYGQQVSIMELRERKRQERLKAIKSQILSQLGATRLTPANSRKTQTNCRLSDREEQLINQLFIEVQKSPDGSINPNELLKPNIVKKLEGLSPTSWACFKSAITAAAAISYRTDNSTNPSPGSSFFNQSNLSNRTLNDMITQQQILERRQRRRQERLLYIQSQILSRLGITQRTNSTLPPCKLTDRDKQLLSQVLSKIKRTGDGTVRTNEVIPTSIFQKLQGFNPSCKVEYNETVTTASTSLEQSSQNISLTR